MAKNIKIFPKLNKKELMEKIKLDENGYLNLRVEQFIALFSDEQKNNDIITKAKDISKHGIIISAGTLDRYAKNDILAKNQTDDFEKALNIARKHGIKCRFCSWTRYSKGNLFYPVDKALKATKQINAWADEINNARVNGKKLTQFEKVLYAYEIVSKYSYKLEDKEANGNLSRTVIHVLTGDKICCAGFERIYRHILNRVGIHCSYLYLPPLPEYEFAHAVSLVYIDDDSYDLHGIFVSEPTWGRTQEGEGKATGRDYKYAYMTINKARETYKRNGLDLNEEQLYKAKQELFASVYPEDEIKFQKMMLNKRKEHYLKNLKGFVVDDKKFFKRATKEVKKIASKFMLNKVEEVKNEKKRGKEYKPAVRSSRLTQNALSKNYKKEKEKQKGEDLIEKLVRSTTDKMDDLYRYDKITEDSPVFNNNGSDIIKDLIKSKHSVDEIVHGYSKKLKEFVQKTNKEILEEEFDDFLDNIKEISEEKFDRISQIRKRVIESRDAPNLSGCYYVHEIAKGALNVGLAKGLSNTEAKCFALARLHAWSDNKLKLAQAKVKSDEYLDDLDLESLDNIF